LYGCVWFRVYDEHDGGIIEIVDDEENGEK
jgi:hypothetical protein